MLYLFPRDVFNPRAVDAHFAPEAAAVRRAGYEVKLVDVDALDSDEAQALAWPAVSTPYGEVGVYRGWMLSPAAYRTLSTLLADKGVSLRSLPSHYQQAHELPGWYDGLREYTPKTVELAATDLAPALADLGAAKVFVKDYTKSLKSDPSASVIEDATDVAAAEAVVARFLEQRGEYLAGNVVLREFEQFSSTELRTWWVYGELALVTAHPDTPTTLAPATASFVPDGFAAALRSLGLPFVTADFVQREDGVWRMVELGDGQVSDRPVSTDPDEFFAKVLAP